MLKSAKRVGERKWISRDKKTWVMKTYETYDKRFAVFLFWLSFHTDYLGIIKASGPYLRLGLNLDDLLLLLYQVIKSPSTVVCIYPTPSIQS